MRLAKEIVVVNFCSINQILSTRSHNLKKLLLCMALFRCCKLNFIEQYWGAVKFHYCSFHNKPTTIEEMEKWMLECLDNIPLLHIQW